MRGPVPATMHLALLAGCASSSPEWPKVLACELPAATAPMRYVLFFDGVPQKSHGVDLPKTCLVSGGAVADVVHAELADGRCGATEDFSKWRLRRYRSENHALRVTGVVASAEGIHILQDQTTGGVPSGDETINFWTVLVPMGDEPIAECITVTAYEPYHGAMPP